MKEKLSFCSEVDSPFWVPTNTLEFHHLSVMFPKVIAYVIGSIGKPVYVKSRASLL